MERNLEATEGDRTEVAVRLVRARCMVMDVGEPVGKHTTKETCEMGIKSSKALSQEVGCEDREENSKMSFMMDLRFFMSSKKKIGVAESKELGCSL